MTESTPPRDGDEPHPPDAPNPPAPPSPATPPPGPAPASAPRLWWRRLRSRWWARWGMDIALILLIFWGVGRYQSRHLLDDATLAPDFALTDVSGQTHRLSDYRGKAVLLVFWAPWCTVCHLEADNWSRVQSWRDDVQLLAVAMSFESRAAVAEFVGDAPYPVLLGTDAIGAAYRVNSYPTHYLIDPEGRVAWQGVGYTTTVGLWMRVVASG